MNDVLWIIDGYNLIRRDPQLSVMEEERGSAAARAFLEGQLASFRARQGRGHSVVLVYDGVPPPGAPPKVTKGFRVLYAGHPGNADLEVLREVRRAEGRAEVHVVTSDVQDIAGRLRGLSIQLHHIDEFQQRLHGSRPPGGPGVEEKPEAPRGEEVDFWLREFEGESGDGQGESR